MRAPGRQGVGRGRVIVREARRADRSSIARLWLEADRMHKHLHPEYFQGDGRVDPRLEQCLDQQSDSREIFVAERDGTVVGFVLVEILAPSRLHRATARRRGHIDILIVAPGARRLGCGRRLLETAAYWARLRRVEEVLLTVWAGNDEAEAFYEAQGLESVSRVMRMKL